MKENIDGYDEIYLDIGNIKMFLEYCIKQDLEVSGITIFDYINGRFNLSGTWAPEFFISKMSPHKTIHEYVDNLIMPENIHHKVYYTVDLVSK